MYRIGGYLLKKVLNVMKKRKFHTWTTLKEFQKSFYKGYECDTKFAGLLSYILFGDIILSGVSFFKSWHASHQANKSQLMELRGVFAATPEGLKKLSGRILSTIATITDKKLIRKGKRKEGWK